MQCHTIKIAKKLTICGQM